MKKNKRELIGRNISIIYRNENNYMDIKLKKYNINKVQSEVLVFLEDFDGANQRQINEFFLFNKATITKIINHLENNGYVKRKVCKADRREKYTYLTEKGRSLLPKVKEVFEGWEGILVNSIDDEDVVKIKYLLADMVDNITSLKGEY